MCNSTSVDGYELAMRSDSSVSTSYGVEREPYTRRCAIRSARVRTRSKANATTAVAATDSAVFGPEPRRLPSPTGRTRYTRPMNAASMPYTRMRVSTTDADSIGAGRATVSVVCITTEYGSPARSTEGAAPDPVVGARRTPMVRLPHLPRCRGGRYPCLMAFRLVLAEDNVLMREGIRTLIELEDDLELVAVGEDLDSLLELVDLHDPDVVLTDIRMPPTGTDEGIRAAQLLRESHPDTGVVVLSQYLEPSYALTLFDAGARGRGYLLKERVSDGEQLARAIRDVASGGSVVDPKVVDVLMEARAASRSPVATLHARERETLAEMAQGKNNAAIAEALVLSDRAVEKHITAVFTKLGLSEEHAVHRRVKAVLLYLANQNKLGTATS